MVQLLLAVSYFISSFSPDNLWHEDLYGSLNRTCGTHLLSKQMISITLLSSCLYLAQMLELHSNVGEIDGTVTTARRSKRETLLKKNTEFTTQIGSSTFSNGIFSSLTCQ